MKNMPITVSLLLAAATLAFSPSSAGEPAGAVPPDFTAGGKKDESHDWLLGPTGLRGWMFFRHEDLTAASRQILITAVDKGSPADGIVQVNDVILGVFGKPFADDARRSFGHAIAAAEEKTGILPLMLWRDGKTSNVELKLQVLGAYSATAPYDCPKSKAIFEQGCRLIAEKGFENADIPDHLNALALLASGDEKHHSMLGKYAKKVAESLQPEDTWNWYIAYGNLFLSEYALATGKKTAFPELKQTTLRGVKNQCMNGMWGHAPALADGHSEGYGGMNVIGLPMTISLVLARQAGVSDPALDKAIDKSATFLRYYVDKGAIPYGDHPPWGTRMTTTANPPVPPCCSTCSATAKPPRSTHGWPPPPTTAGSKAIAEISGTCSGPSPARHAAARSPPAPTSRNKPGITTSPATGRAASSIRKSRPATKTTTTPTGISPAAICSPSVFIRKASTSLAKNHPPHPR